MCVCIPPAAAPFFLPLLEWLVAALWALGPFLVPAVTVLLGAVFLTVRGAARVVAWPVVAWLEHRSDRLHNERMAEIYPHLRAQLPAPRQRVEVSVVRPEPAELAAAPLAIEAPRPQLMPPSVRMYVTPLQEINEKGRI